MATPHFQGDTPATEWVNDELETQPAKCEGWAWPLWLLQDWRAAQINNTGPGTSYLPASDTAPAADPDLWGGASNQFLISGLWGLVKRRSPLSHELN